MNQSPAFSPLMSSSQSSVSSGQLSPSSKQKSATKLIKEEKKSAFLMRSSIIKEMISYIPLIYRQLMEIEKEVERSGKKGEKYYQQLSDGTNYIFDKSTVKEYLEYISREVTQLEKDAAIWVKSRGQRSSALTKPIMYKAEFINFLAGSDMGPYVRPEIRNGELDKKSFKGPNRPDPNEPLVNHLISLNSNPGNPFYRFVGPSTVQSMLTLAMYYDGRYRGSVVGKTPKNQDLISLSPAMRQELANVIRSSIQLDYEKVLKRSNQGLANDIVLARDNALFNLENPDSERSTFVNGTNEEIINPNRISGFNRTKLLEGAKETGDNRYGFLTNEEFNELNNRYPSGANEKEKMDYAYAMFLNPDNLNRFLEFTGDDVDVDNLISVYRDKFNNESESLTDEDFNEFLQKKFISIALNNQSTLVKMASEYKTWVKDTNIKNIHKENVKAAKNREAAILRSQQRS